MHIAANLIPIVVIGLSLPLNLGLYPNYLIIKFRNFLNKLFLSRFNSTLEYKPPTSLTIFTLLIITIAFMFILYCFCVLFCYCFKCGLFRKPKLVIINSMPASNSSDSTSAQIISPKHSSLSSSTSNSSSLSSATSPIANNRTRNQRNRSNSNSRNNYKSSVARVISNQHQNSYNKRSKRTSQSPTARASSNRNSNSQQLYADPQCYVDYDNDTPFLIQSKSSSTRVPSSKQSRSSNPRRSNSSTSASNHNRQSKSYRDNYSSTVQATPLFSSSNSNRSSIQRTTSLSNHPIGTAVALIDDDLLNLNHSNHNQLETIAQSRSNSRSSLSIDLGTSLMEIVESEQINGTNHQQLISINEVASAPYYLDEKPPSYDDIIKNDNLNKTNSS
jgi:hypothetical protein